MNLLVSVISYFQCDIHITPYAFDVIGIEGFCIPSFQDTAFAAFVAIVQAFPCFAHIGSAFLFGGVFYLWWLHCYSKIYLYDYFDSILSFCCINHKGYCYNSNADARDNVRSQRLAKHQRADKDGCNGLKYAKHRGFCSTYVAGCNG